MFPLLCSLDLDVLRAQRIIGFFYLIIHKSTRSEAEYVPLKYAALISNTWFKREVSNGLMYT